MSGIYDKAREGFGGGLVSWTGDTIKTVLVDLNDYAKPITAATNATPIVVTAAAHGFASGDYVTISGVLGNLAANGYFRIANVTTNTFELTNPLTLANVAGSGAYTSGGFAVDLSKDQYLSDLPSVGRVGTPQTLGSKTNTLGVLDAADVTFPSVTGDQSEAVAVYKDTGTEATSLLLLLMDAGTGLPVTPNGGNISIVFDNGPFKIARI